MDFGQKNEKFAILDRELNSKGNKPINIGHSYSVLTALPEKEETGNTSWAIPLTVERVKMAFIWRSPCLRNKIFISFTR